MQQPNRKNGCLTGCLAIVGVIVGLFIIAIIAAAFASNAASTSTASTSTTGARVARNSSAHKSQPQPTAAPQVDYCDKASTLEQEGVAAYNAGRYRTAYTDATNGLTANDSCDAEDDSIVNRGYLLSIKGLSEHYLPEGDSRTDLNEANQVLVECQTRPGLYGTHVAAECETQEQNNIHQQTTWEMDGG